MIKKIIAGLLAVVVVGFSVYKLFFEKPSITDQAADLAKNLNAYHLEANMEIYNNEDKREFFINVDYLKDDGTDFFKVSMLDKGLNQEQLIIKNSEGTFVLTPALNKVYQFNGDWPMSSPKPYIIQSLLGVFEEEHTKTQTDSGVIITAYPKFDNKQQWHKQEIKFDKDLKPLYVNIYNKDNNNVVSVNFTKIDYSSSLSTDDFDVESALTKARETTTSLIIDETELPYVPVYSATDAVLKETTSSIINGQLVYILTYEGEKSFTIVQRILAPGETTVTTSISGQLVDLMNGVGYFQNGVLTFVYNGIEYNIYSVDLTLDEMIELANSMETNNQK